MQPSMSPSEVTVNGISKIDQYKWSVLDTEGVPKSLSKHAIQIDRTYQREANVNKVRELAGKWSWLGCGAIVVGERGGMFYAIDGQHRVLAAQSRSDITHLPCIVFSSDSAADEARAFLLLNKNRKPITAFASFRAAAIAADPLAAFVTKALNDRSISVVGKALRPREMRSVAWAMRSAKFDPSSFLATMDFAVELCTEGPMHERMLDALFHINRTFADGGLSNPRLRDRMLQVGAKRLTDAMARAAAFYVRGGAKVWATGVFEELNKGLRLKFTLPNSPDVG